MKSADRNELAQISSQPSSDFTSFVGDFKLLNTLLPLVSPRVCSKAGGVYASDGMWEYLQCTKIHTDIMTPQTANLHLILSVFPPHSLLRGILWSDQHSVHRPDVWFAQVSLESSRGPREWLCGPICATLWPGSAYHSRTASGESRCWRLFLMGSLLHYLAFKKIQLATL